jgi:phosphoribosylformylglycinamidine synthase subunit PurL
VIFQLHAGRRRRWSRHDTLTPELIAQHQLTEPEYRKIVDILGREPSYTELGIFSVMWSEHCSYKSSRLHLKKLPTRGKLVVQGPGENAGIIDIGGGYVIAFKIESHNHPSFIEPFQGAATGVGGILRDIFTMGARPIAVLDSLRFGPLDDPRQAGRATAASCRAWWRHRALRQLFRRAHGGRRVHFRALLQRQSAGERVRAGRLQEGRDLLRQSRGRGQSRDLRGRATGRDGIHGASMASAEFTEESKQKRPNVQVGDPFMEKLLLEACLEAMQTGAIVGIQDMGAAGSRAPPAKWAAAAAPGRRNRIGPVPQRETGMTPYEIMLSESQERMLLVAERARRRSLPRCSASGAWTPSTIGTVTGDGKLRVMQSRRPSPKFPIANWPTKRRSTIRRIHRRRGGGAIPEPEGATGRCSAPCRAAGGAGHLLQALDLGAVRLQVRTNTVAGPGADAAIVRIKETGTIVAMSLDGNGRYCYLSPREGAKLAVAECCRNLATVGARRWRPPIA